jgi:hypothetical protein
VHLILPFDVLFVVSHLQSVSGMSSSDVLASPSGVDVSSSPKSPLAKTQQPDKDSKPVTKQNPVPASPPLHGLKLAPHRELEQAQQRGRLKCSSCGGSRMFFCYTCCSLVGVSQQEIPSVKVRERSGALFSLLALLNITHTGL